MLVESKKLIPWTKKNYVVSILHFVMHAILLAVLVVGFVALDNYGDGGVEGFFAQTHKFTNYI